MPPRICVDRQILDLALQISQSARSRAPDGVFLFTPGRIEEGAAHILPEPFDILRILADQTSGALLQRIFRTALADPRDAGIGLDRDHQCRFD